MARFCVCLQVVRPSPLIADVRGTKVTAINQRLSSMLLNVVLEKSPT